jgi:hypothetical protein
MAKKRIIRDMPAAKLAEHALVGKIGYRDENAIQSRGVKIHGECRRRNGTENIFGSESGNNYPLIASQEQYRRNIQGVYASAFYERKAADDWQYLFLPTVGYEKNEERYLSPSLQKAMKE